MRKLIPLLAKSALLVLLVSGIVVNLSIFAFAATDPTGLPWTDADLEATNTISHSAYLIPGSDGCLKCHAYATGYNLGSGAGSFRGLRATSVKDMCDYCHLTGLSFSQHPNVVTDENGHTMGYIGNAPHSVDEYPWSTPSSGFTCVECHSVHDVNTVQLIGYSSNKLLKNNPNPNSPTVFTSNNYLSEWCADCHTADFGLHTEPKTVGKTARYGHDVSEPGMSATQEGWASVNVNPGDNINQGPTCKQCHPANGGTGDAPFPHSGGNSPSLLVTGTMPDQMDYACGGCHNVKALP